MAFFTFPKQTLEDATKWVSSYYRQDDIFSPNNSIYDFSLEKGILKIVNSLETPIFMGVFCEKRATEYQVPNIFLRKGHYTTLLRSDGHEVGSLLWFYKEKKVLTQDLLPLVKDEIQTALQFLITQGQASDIQVDGSYNYTTNSIALDIKVTGKNGIDVFNKSFNI